MIAGASLDIPTFPAFISWMWFAGVFAAGWVSCWIVSRLSRDDRKAFLHAILIALFVVFAAAAYAAGPPKPDKPSATFCLGARQARDVAGSEKAAEDAARARGISEATIARAKRCLR
jgi:hypothetical protein